MLPQHQSSARTHRSGAALLLGASLLCLLGACGGGGNAGDAGGNAASVSASNSLGIQAFALVAILHDYCKVTEPIRSTQPGISGMSYSPFVTWSNNGLLEQSGSIYAWGNAEVSTVGALRLQTDYRDYRDVLGKAMVSAGLVDGRGMGVMILDILPDQAVGCVRSVTHPVFSATTDAYGLKSVAGITWSGRITGPLPMASLQAEPITGFEFAANFLVANDAGYVYFNVPKTDVGDPAASRICHLATGTINWNCMQPAVRDAGALWIFSIPGVKPGTYVLL